LANALCARDRDDEALARWDEAIGLVRRVGDRVWERLMVIDSCNALLLTGGWDEAAARLDAAPQSELHGIAALGFVTARTNLETYRGRLAEAERTLLLAEFFEASADVQERTGYSAAEATVLRPRGEIR